MENAQKFPLLRLPALALQEVLKSLMPDELLKFAKSSSKSKMILKAFTKTENNRNRFKLELEFGKKIFISFYGKNWKYEFNLDRFDSKPEILYDGDGPIPCYECSDLREAFRSSQYMMDLLNCEVSSIIFDTDRFFRESVKLTSWLKSKSIESLRIVGRNAQCDAFRLCTDLEITKTLDLPIYIRENSNLQLPKHLSHLRILSAKWVTLEKLLAIDSRMIALGVNKLSVADLETFFTGWIQSRHHQNLKYFEVVVTDFLLVNAMFWNNIGGQIFYNGIAPAFGQRMRIGGTVVKRIDGTTGTIFLNLNRLYMIVH